MLVMLSPQSLCVPLLPPANEVMGRSYFHQCVSVHRWSGYVWSHVPSEGWIYQGGGILVGWVGIPVGGGYARGVGIPEWGGDTRYTPHGTDLVLTI